MTNSVLIQPWIRDFIGSRQNQLKVLREVTVWRTPECITWEQVAEMLHCDYTTLLELNPKLSKIKLLREGTVIKYPGKALGVSYTEEGLKFVCTNKGEMVYFDNVLFSDLESLDFNSLTKSDKVFVENFVPKNHYRPNSEYLNMKFQTSEIMVTDKALRMFYVSGFVEDEPDKVLVYSSEKEE